MGAEGSACAGGGFGHGALARAVLQGLGSEVIHPDFR